MILLNALQAVDQTASCQNMTDTSAVNTSAVLEADSLHFSYDGQVVFDHFSARVVPGVTLLKGGSGRGKSTLLGLLAGTLAASKGHLSINGISLQHDTAAYRQQVLWTEPCTDAFDQLTALDYFELQRQTHGGFLQAPLAWIVNSLGLQPHLDKPLYRLSTGSRRKVWLTAAFASEAAVTLLDEPFAALDRPSIDCVSSLLENAATHTTRAWVLAHHEAPGNVQLAHTIDLGD